MYQDGFRPADKHPPGENGAGRPRAISHARMTVLDYFNLGLQRGKHAAARPVVGDVVVGDVVRGSTGVTLRYQLLVEHGVVRQVSFKAPTCVTLVAYCEILAQWATGMSLREVICIRGEELADRLVGAPACKRDRAWLAVQAMQNAVAAAVKASPHQNKEHNS